MKKLFLIILFLTSGKLVETFAQTPSAGRNSIMEQTPREAMTTVVGANHTTIQTTIQYFDGLARPTQTILYRASPDATKDIVASNTEYDVFGRAYKSLLPTPSDVLTGAYQTAPQSLAQSFYGGDTYPYNQSVFENSPLNRVVEQFGAGQAWRVAGNEKSSKITYGAAGNEILEFRMNTTGDVDVLGTYGGSSLSVQTVTSERGFRTNEYKDRLGRVVAKSQELTSGVFAVVGFVYDDLNRLRVVIQPEAYKTVSTMTSFTQNSTVFKEGMFYYLYDARGRVAQKMVPGGGTTRYVYDRNDRVVLQNDDRDANIPSPGINYYKFTKYDIFGRPVMTGLINNIGGFSQSQLQKDFDDFTGQSYETAPPSGAGGLLLGYTNVSFPSSYTPQDGNVRTVTYYDDYAWQTETAYNFQAGNAYHVQGNTKGMVTGSLIRNLETNVWYKSVKYYDYKGRSIQTFTQNHLGGIDRIDYQYRFNGEVLAMRIVHLGGTPQGITEVYYYQYDHFGRKTKFLHSLNGKLKVIAKYDYDKIGRLKTKQFSPSDAIGSNQSGLWTQTGTWQGGSLPTISDQVTINTGHTVTIPNGQTVQAGTLFNQGILQNFGTLQMGTLAGNNVGTLQSVDYSYYIRGLKGINLDANNNLTNKLFSMKLGYEETGYYDGNIGKQEWKSSLDGLTRSYTYNYDGANRILSGTYAGGKPNENYSLNSVVYDGNGNIVSLSRNGFKANNTFGLIDNLSYNYPNGSNKIQAVTDISGETASFTDVVGSTDYTYYPDGSLKSDANKGITLIEYNYLKLPKKYTFLNGSTLENQYDATGKKLKSVSSDGTIYDFVGNIIHKNNVLYQISHDEGRIINGEYEYEIKDYLGNLRVSFRDSLGVAKITQKQDYDVYGSELQGLSYTKPLWNQDNFKFLGRESIAQTGYVDLMNRQYDKILGRFTSPDPVTDGQESQSLFQYGWNNPLRYTDPDGRMAKDVNLTGKEAQAAFTELQASVKKDLTLSMDANGKVSYTQNGTGKISKDSKQLVNAIDDHSIVVNVSAENTTTTKSGSLYIGGAFSGNTVTQGANGNTVVAEQEVNPSVLSTMSTAHGKSGADVLHEVSEAYQGALISQKSGISSPASNSPNSIYPKAHNKATAQSGQIFQNLYDASKNVLQMNPNGSYPVGIKSVEWYVNDQKGNNVIIQILK